MGCFTSCFGGGQSQEDMERERLDSAEVRQNAARAAQQRQEQYEKSAAGRAAKAHREAVAKQSKSSNPGEPVLKWQMG